MIRNLKPTDREAYIDLKLKCFGYSYVLEFNEYTYQRTFIWEENERLIGSCKWTLMRGKWFQKYALIGTLMVHPDYQGKGIGTSLVAATLKNALNSVRVACLEDGSRFGQSSRIAKALGFKEKKYKEWWISRGDYYGL